MQTYYGKRAPVYDRSMGYDNPETIESLAPVIGRIQDLLRGRNVLEIACGPGFWTGIVSEVAESVLATDYNASTLGSGAKQTHGLGQGFAAGRRRV